MKKLITIAAFVVLATGAFAQLISQISVTATKNTMTVGETMQLTATISPQTVTNSNLTWASSDTQIATVDSNGLVTAVGEGAVSISANAMDGTNINGIFQISVSFVYVTEVQLVTPTTEIMIGQTYQITSLVLPSNASVKQLNWSSNNTAIATVDNYGVVTAIASGTATIKAFATDGSGKFTTVDVVVVGQTNTPVQSVYIPQKEYFITTADSIPLEYSIYPANASNKSVTFSSSNPNVAMVNASGKIIPYSLGTAVITVTTVDGSKKDTTTVNVIPPQILPSTVMLSHKQISISPSTVPFKLFAEVLPLNADNKNVTWEVMDTNIVQMISPGEFIVKNIGSTQIFVRTEVGTAMDYCYVIVQAIQAEDVALSRKAVTMQLGTEIQLQAYVKPLQTTNKLVYWMSSNDAVASVNLNGSVIAISEGQAYIVANVMQSGGVSDTCIVTVINEQITVVKEMTNATITIGNLQNTKYTISDYLSYNGSQAITFQAISTNPAVARAFVQGNILGIVPYTAGTTTIILQAKTNGGLSQQVHATFTVESPISTTICSSLGVTADIHNVSCAGKNDGYVIVSGTGGTAPYSYRWSNYRTDAMLKNVPAGEYKVVVTDANKCMKVETVSILEPQPIEIVANVTNPSCGESNGSVSLQVQGGTAPYSFEWNIASSLPTVMGLDAGLYSVKVTDDEGCETSKVFGLNNTKAPIIFLKDIVETNCNPNTGAIDIEIIGGTGAMDITWSNNAKTEDLQNVAAGRYEVTVIDEALCKSSASFVIPAIPFEQPEISLVTVGDTSKLNLIIWEKEASDGIGMYTIYRETSIPGVFESIGTQPYTAPSLFADPTANPMERSYRYRISATHNCGEESTLSAQKAEYKTINLQRQITPDSVVFTWDSYEGFDFYSYVLYKRVQKDNIEIARIPSTQNRYVVYEPDAALSNYFVGIELPKALNPKGPAKIESGPFVLAMSNIAEAQTSITSLALSRMYAYPTSVKQNLTIVFDTESTKNSVCIYTIQGVEVYNSGVVSDAKIVIPAQSLAPGAYIVKLQSDSKQAVQSIVIE